MKIIGLLLSWLIVAAGVAAQDNYAVSAIPEPLLNGANVVKRIEDIRFEIINSGEAILKKKYALTILNESGDRRAPFLESYDKLMEIRSVEAALYDAFCSFPQSVPSDAANL